MRRSNGRGRCRRVDWRCLWFSSLPSLAPAIVSLAMFVVLTLLYFGQLYRYRAFRLPLLQSEVFVSSPLNPSRRDIAILSVNGPAEGLRSPEANVATSSAKTDGFWTVQTIDDRLLRTSMLLLRTDSHRRLRHPGNQPDPCPAGPVRGVHLHDSRPSNPNPSRRLTGALGHQDICHWRRCLVDATGQRRWNPGSRHLGALRYRGEDNDYGAFCADIRLWILFTTTVLFHRRVIRQPMVMTIAERTLWKIHYTTSLIVIFAASSKWYDTSRETMDV